jgi:hypothetical protein
VLLPLGYCDDCDEEYIKAYSQLHLDRCPYTYIRCLRGGADCGGTVGGGLFCRKDTKEHDDICPNFRCAFLPSPPFLFPLKTCSHSCTTNLDCKTKSTRKNIAIHEKQCDQIRLRLRHSSAEVAKLQTASAKKDDEIARLQEEVAQLKSGAEVSTTKQEEAGGSSVESLRTGPSQLSSPKLLSRADPRPSSKHSHTSQDIDDEVLVIEPKKRRKST